MRTFAFTSMLLIILYVSMACSSDPDGIGTPPQAEGNLEPETLVVALLPDEDPAEILRLHDGLKNFLQERLQRQVELVVHHDYGIMVEAMRSGHLHLAYFGPATYIVCKDAGTHIEPFAAKKRGGSTTYTGIIIANPDSGVRTISDIAGKTMAYGDPGSTSSHLIPKRMLLAENLRPRHDYNEVFLGSHDAVAMNVATGNVAAGGMSVGIYTRLVEQGSIDPQHAVVIAESPSYPQYPWTMRSDLSPALQRAIRDAFLQLDDADILAAMQADGFGPVSDQDYDIVRELEKTVADYR
ncbi:MAG: phosphate/phosphite/phosphonate ABC transporter substrate-binding protein [Planctomycetota bacterium]|nr:MAG: phosphate/phosphite/phosphonate ABC transporter substrate-binding protein [Planctomycetota bacterium]